LSRKKLKKDLLTFTDDGKVGWKHRLTAFATLTPKHIDCGDLVSVISPRFHYQADLVGTLNNITNLDLTFPIVVSPISEDGIISTFHSVSPLIYIM